MAGNSCKMSRNVPHNSQKLSKAIRAESERQTVMMGCQMVIVPRIKFHTKPSCIPGMSCHVLPQEMSFQVVP
uniref:Uncharacterized protein n=1 Tax=Anguilla anguilla TaxID=7936 RepID=A0A0E9TB61_ANGAN